MTFLEFSCIEAEVEVNCHTKSILSQTENVSLPALFMSFCISFGDSVHDHLITGVPTYFG